MKNLVTTCICALSLLACGSGEKSEEIRNENSGTQTEQAPTRESMTESQVFAYILGEEYDKSLYLNNVFHVSLVVACNFCLNQTLFGHISKLCDNSLEEYKS